MSASEKFTIELPDGQPLTKDDLVEHRDHGPMYVDDIRVGPHHKRVTLVSELGAAALKLTGDDIREQWGETLHADPSELWDGETRVSRDGISIDGLDISLDITVEGAPEWAIQAVDAHTLDAAVRVLEAVRDGHHPKESEGAMEIDWETVLENHEPQPTLGDFDEEAES